MLTTKTQAIRVLLVDDHEVIRVGLRTVLGQTQGVTVVGEAGTMADAIQQAQRLKPDVILMDVRLPDGSGVDACREILGALPGTRVIFLTSYRRRRLHSRRSARRRSWLRPQRNRFTRIARSHPLGCQRAIDFGLQCDRTGSAVVERASRSAGDPW